MTIKHICCFIISLSLCCCGFRPVYQQNQINGNQLEYLEELAAIKVEIARKKLNQDLKSNLEKTLNPNQIKVEARYIITIELTKDISSTFITSTGSSGRNKITLSAKYKLKDIESGELISEGKTEAKEDFDINIDKRFANYTAEEQISSNLTLIIANNIRDLLITDISGFCENKK